MMTNGLLAAGLPQVRAGGYDPSKVQLSPVSPSRLEIHQNTSSAIINWNSFDIAGGSTVQFYQPDVNSRTLNRIFDLKPSQINGNLSANGQIYLINSNGIIFGKNSVVNVSGLVASALNITDDVFSNGFLSVQNNTNIQDRAAFTFIGSLDGTPGGADASGHLADGSVSTVSVENGASLTASTGGSIFLFAPKVENAGRIETTEGQVVLAAGQRVYLAQSGDPALRGMLVEVDPFAGNSADTSTVSNTAAVDAAPTRVLTQDQLKDAVRGIIANRGNITLAAVAVNNDGLLRATTGRIENGSIYLHARYGAGISTVSDPNGPTQAQQGGALTLGSNSLIETPVETITDAEVIQLAQQTFQADPANANLSDAETQSRLAALQDLIRKQYSVTRVDPTSTAASDFGSIVTNADGSQQRLIFRPSVVDLDARTALLDGGSQIVSPGGTVTVKAESDRPLNNSFGVLNKDNPDASARVVVATNASIDVAGLQNVAVDGARNQVSDVLVSANLADSPLQRDGVLNRQTVSFDLRDAPDGKLGIADMSGTVNNIQYSTLEAATAGGQISVQSEGAAVLEQGSQLNVSGGSIHYSDATIETSVLRAGSTRTAITAATPGQRYDQLSSDAVGSSLKPISRFSAAYTEGHDAGTIAIAARGQQVVDGNLLGGVTVGALQRNPNVMPRGGQLIVGDSSGGPASSPSFGSDIQFAAGDAITDYASFSASPLTAPLPDNLATQISPSIFAGTTSDSTAGGFTRGAFYASHSIDILDPLQLLPNSQFTLNTLAGDVDIAADVSGAGLDFSASAGSSLSNSPSGNVLLAAGKRIDTSGMWINDWAAFRNGQTVFTGVRALDGGSVTLNAKQNVNLGTASLIDVSGGAALDYSGAPSLGNAGSITLSSAGNNLDPGQIGSVNLGGQVQGYAAAFNGKSGAGGTLSIRADAIDISDGTSTAGQAQNAGDLVLAPSFFGTGGFSDYTLTADLGDAQIAPGTQIDVKRQVRAFQNSGQSGPSTGAVFGQFATLTQLSPLQVDPTSFSLSASVMKSDGSGPNILSSVTVGDKASVSVGTGGSISLLGSRQVALGGSLIAPAGKVSLRILGTQFGADLSSVGTTPQTAFLGFIPDRYIFMTADSNIDVSGRSLVFANGSGQRQGQVLAAGSVNLDALDDGAVIAQSGASIDLDGASATVDLPQQETSEVVGSDAGSLTIGARESVLFAANVSAHGGTTNNAGGNFSLALNRQGDPYGSIDFRNVVSPLNSPYSQDPRVVTVSDGALGKFILPALQGLSLGLSINSPGIVANAYVDPLQLAGAGFDNIALRSDSAIRFDGNTNLSAARQIQLTAPLIETSDGANASVTAPHLVLSNPDQRATIDTPVSVSAGSGTLTLSAHASSGTGSGLIDVQGSVGISGVAQTTIDSDGDMRLTGNNVVLGDVGTAQPTTRLEGSLSIAGPQVTVQADQIYPTTLSDFSIRVPQGDLTIAGNGFTPDVPLSAGGSLHVNANSIFQNGVVRAPFGALDLLATDQLVLGPGSVTSASAEGALIPFGRLQDGTDYVYDGFGTDNGTRVFTQVAGDLQPTVRLQGKTVDEQASATVNVAGGGDLFGFEFVPGPRGTTDILSQPGSYAIVPGFKNSYAPYDQIYSQNFGLAAGSQIQILSGADGLAAGTYTLLPARYALLPGAYLITPQTGFTDIQSDHHIDLAAGGAVVAGRRSVAGTAIRDSRTQGYLVQSHDQVIVTSGELDAAQAAGTTVDASRGLSEYNIGLASNFFDRPAASGQPAPRLPADGGQLILAAIDSIELEGGVDLQAAESTASRRARGGLLDISMASTDAHGKPSGNLLVTDSSPADVPVSGTLSVDASKLAGLGAESIVFGGERTYDSTTGLSTLNVTAKTVSFASSQGLADKNGSAPAEVILAATDIVNVADGSHIAVAAADTSRPASLPLSVQGNGALLRVAADDQSVIRTGATAPGSITATTPGNLNIGANVSLTGDTVQTDATQDTHISDSASINARSFALGASQITLGGTSATGVSMDNNLLASLSGAVQDITLRGYDGIRIAGDFGGSKLFSRLTLDGPSLDWVGTAGGSASLAANTVTLTNTTGQAPSTSGGLSSDGSLTLAARVSSSDAQSGRIVVGAGDVALRGLDSATLVAQSGIVFDAASTQTVGAPANLTLTTGDLNLNAPIITGTAGANHAVNVQAGKLNTAPGSDAASPLAAGQSAEISFTAQSILHNTNLDVTGGSLTLTATGAADSNDASAGNVTLAAGSRIAATGSTTDAGGTSTSAPAGSVTLASQQGSVIVAGSENGAAAAVVDVSGRGAGNAGSLSVVAPKGEFVSAGVLHASVDTTAAANGLAAGQFTLDAQRVASLDALAQQTSEFTGRRYITARTGDLNLSSSSSITARNISLAANAGSIFIDGVLDATGPEGGSIMLAARRAVDPVSNAETGGTVQVTGQLLANATAANGQGGSVEIDVSADTSAEESNTHIVLAPGSIVNVAGTNESSQAQNSGQLVFRAPRVNGPNSDFDSVAAQATRAVLTEGGFGAATGLPPNPVTTDGGSFQLAGNVLAPAKTSVVATGANGAAVSATTATFEVSGSGLSLHVPSSTAPTTEVPNNGDVLLVTIDSTLAGNLGKQVSPSPLNADAHAYGNTNPTGLAGTGLSAIRLRINDGSGSISPAFPIFISNALGKPGVKLGDSGTGLQAGATYRMTFQISGTDVNSGEWIVGDQVSPGFVSGGPSIVGANSRNVLDISSAVPTINQSFSIKPTASDFVVNGHNTQSVYVRFDTGNVATSQELPVYVPSGDPLNPKPVAPGDLLANATYVAHIDSAGRVILADNQTGLSTPETSIRASSATTGVDANLSQVQFTVPQNAAVSGAFKLVLDGGLAAPLFDSTGQTRITQLNAGQTITAVFNNGSYYLAPSNENIEQINLSHSGTSLAAGDLVAFNAGQPASNATDIRASFNGGANLQLQDAQGNLITSLPAGFYVARFTGGAFQVLPSDQQQSSVNVSIDPQAKVAGANSVQVEAVRSYVSTTVDSALETQARTDALAFSDPVRLAILQQRILQGQDINLSIRPGVEVRSPGDLTVTTPWDFGVTDTTGALLWRFPAPGDTATGTVAGTLTLRAAGNLILPAIPGSAFVLNDGFNSTNTPLAQGDQWSYRLVGGADVNAADPLAIRPDVSVASPGDVQIGSRVRTGSGDIDIAAGGNILFTSGTAQVYTAGTRASSQPFATTTALTHPSTADPITFTSGGGHVSLQAGQDITSEAITTGDPTAWLFRKPWTTPSAASPLANPAWWVRFDLFNQQVGALGGGDVSIRAGGNVSNLAVALPSQGIVTGDDGKLASNVASVTNGVAADAQGNPVASTQIQVLKGGNLDMRVGGDLIGSQLLVDSGQGQVQVGGAIRSNQPGSIAADGALRLFAADSGFNISAGSGVVLGGIADTTALNISALNQGKTTVGQAILANNTQFFRYGADSFLNVQSATGDVVANLSGVLPPILSLQAAQGDVQIRNLSDANLFPSSQGQLDILAGGSVVQTPVSNSASNILLPDASSLQLLDIDPSELPSPLRPAIAASNQAGPNQWAYQSLLTRDTDPDTSLKEGVRGGDTFNVAPSVHANDNQPAQIVALNGDVSGSFAIAKPVDVSAGRDVTGLILDAENLRSDQVSIVNAGRDLVAPETRDPVTGQITANSYAIRIFGSGQLEVTTGRDVNLGASEGIVSRGRGKNGFIDSTGASIRVVAGRPGVVDPDAFVARYLSGSDADFALTELDGFLTGMNVAGVDDVARFRNLSQADQVRFGQQLLRDTFIQTYILPPRGDQPAGRYLSQWQAFAQQAGLDASNPAAAPAAQFDRFRYQVLFSELSRSGQQGTAIQQEAKANPGSISPDELQPANLFADGFKAIELAGLEVGDNTPFRISADPQQNTANVRMVFSQIRTQHGGNVQVLVPGGSLDVGGFSTLTSKPASRLGLVATEGDASVFVRDSMNVNTSRFFAVDGGNLLAWASRGDIDAGRGSRTAVSGSSQTLDVDGQSGRVQLVDAGGATGSGIATIFNRPITSGGNVELYAPSGFIDAGEAGIRSAGDVKIGAQGVRGADFIVAVGSTSAPSVPAAPSFSLSPPSATDSNSANSVLAAAPPGAGNANRDKSSILTVEVVAAGDDDAATKRCMPKDKDDRSCDSPADKPLTPPAPQR